MPKGVTQPLLVRLWAYVRVGKPGECWAWTGARSKSGRRKVYYPILKEIRGTGSARRQVIWRVSRLMLILAVGPKEIPRDIEGAEDLSTWLSRANKWYLDQGLEAGHQCDNSECVNPGCLRWETHSENLARQRTRERIRRVA